MKRVPRISRVGISSLLLFMLFARPVLVAAESAPTLVISQFKITSSAGQFITLYNQSDSALNLNEYELDYISSSNKLSSLPITGVLPAHTSYMLSDDQVRLCYQMIVDATSLGLTSTSGSLQVWHMSSDGQSKTLQDRVSWASKATSGATTLPNQNAVNSLSLLRQGSDPSNLQVTTPGSGTWQTVQPDPANSCSLQTVTSAPITIPTNPGNQLQLGASVPGSIVTLASDNDSQSNAPVMPTDDIGLMAPQISEILPNTAEGQNDDTDEFIELYNPNNTGFDLSGFILDVGTTTHHLYTFPVGTTVNSQSFMTFYSAQTHLSLSNSGSQVSLDDPFGNTVSQSDPYTTAKDGTAWAIAKGSWYWTTTITPNASNVITQPSTAKKSAKSTTTTKAIAKTASVITSKGSKNATSASSLAGDTAAASVAQVTPIHPWTLAAVVGLAVLYGAYEYRQDAATRLYQLRRYAESRFRNR